jgi:peptide/nickel transport system ATP-binding protein
MTDSVQLQRGSMPGSVESQGKKTAPVLELKGLNKTFERRPDLAVKLVGLFGAKFDPQRVKAVDDVHLSVGKSEVVGVVGESGCGKSTLGRMAAGILNPTAGEVLFKGRSTKQLKGKEAIDASLGVQMVFQDPMSALNPRHRIGKIISQAPVHHGLVAAAQAEDFAIQLLEQVGLPATAARRFPHQFSGGQRQRINIARALAVNPEVIVADEAVASLDVSIQAQIINLFMMLRRERNLGYMFISHDLGVIEHIADRIVVMYLGKVVEVSPTAQLFEEANHPYTKSLVAERPAITHRRVDYQPLKGEIPSPLNPPTGCHFHPRCPKAMERCRVEAPRLRVVAADQMSACHLND